MLSESSGSLLEEGGGGSGGSRLPWGFVGVFLLASLVGRWATAENRPCCSSSTCCMGGDSCCAFKNNWSWNELGEYFHNDLCLHRFAVRDSCVEARFFGEFKNDLMHDFQPIGALGPFLDDFITSLIPVVGPSAGMPPRTGNSIKPTKISLDLRAPTELGDLHILASGNWFYLAAGPMVLQPYEVYAELGRLQFGWAYSVFAHPESVPDTLDYQGPNSSVQARWPLICWNQPLSNRVTWRSCVEFPLDNRFIQGTSEVLELEARTFHESSGINGLPEFLTSERDFVEAVPDLTMSFKYDTETAHLMAGGVYRWLILRAVDGSRPDETLEGWGLRMAGSVGPADGDSLQFSTIWGEGIGAYLEDLAGTQADLVINPLTGRGEVLPVFGAFMGYLHRWKPDWRSTVACGHLMTGSSPFKPDFAYRDTNFLAGNLIWTVRPRLEVGVEYLWGSRTNEDGQSASATRLQFSVIYKFGADGS